MLAKVFIREKADYRFLIELGLFHCEYCHAGISSGTRRPNLSSPILNVVNASSPDPPYTTLKPGILE
jgi:hypothetical protein